MPEETKRTYQLRKRLQDYLFSHLDHLELNGHPTERLPGNLNVSFAYVEGEALMMAIKNVAVSPGLPVPAPAWSPATCCARAASLRIWRTLHPVRHRKVQHRRGSGIRGQVRGRSGRRLREMSPLYEMAKEGIDLSKIEWAAH